MALFSGALGTMEAENMVFTGSFWHTGTLRLLIHQRVPASYQQLQLGHLDRPLQVLRLFLISRREVAHCVVAQCVLSSSHLSPPRFPRMAVDPTR